MMPVRKFGNFRASLGLASWKIIIVFFVCNALMFFLAQSQVFQAGISGGLISSNTQMVNYIEQLLPWDYKELLGEHLPAIFGQDFACKGKKNADRFLPGALVDTSFVKGEVTCSGKLKIEGIDEAKYQILRGEDGIVSIRVLSGNVLISLEGSSVYLDFTWADFFIREGAGSYRFLVSVSTAGTSIIFLDGHFKVLALWKDEETLFKLAPLLATNTALAEIKLKDQPKQDSRILIPFDSVFARELFSEDAIRDMDAYDKLLKFIAGHNIARPVLVSLDQRENEKNRLSWTLHKGEKKSDCELNLVMDQKREIVSMGNIELIGRAGILQVDEMKNARYAFMHCPDKDDPIFSNLLVLGGEKK